MRVGGGDGTLEAQAMDEAIISSHQGVGLHFLAPPRFAVRGHVKLLSPSVFLWLLLVCCWRLLRVALLKVEERKNNKKTGKNEKAPECTPPREAMLSTSTNG